MTTHPAPEQLQRLLEEALSDTDRHQVETHVDGCAECQRVLAGLTSTAPGVDWQLLQVPTRPAGDPLPFLERVKQTPPQTGHLVATVPGKSARGVDALREWQDSLPQAQEFVILEKLGQGGFGTVFKAYDTRLEQPVALKVLHPDLAEHELQRARFEREARKAAAVRHDHVVTVHRLAHHAGLPFLVMEFIPGEPLSARLKREGRLPPREAAEIVRQVALGLAAAHAQNVVHRDIKPSNILLDGRTGRARIADFGIAREIEGAGPRVTSTDERPGTLEYMSPEHLRGTDHLDGRSDLYSLGVLLYELLTGELPFRGQAHMVIQQVLEQEPRPPRRLNEHIPADLDTITLKLLAKEPARRYQSAQELAEDLQRFLSGEPILARRVTTLARWRHWLRRRPAVAVALVACVVAVLALTGVGIAGSYNAHLNDLNEQLNGKNTELDQVNKNLDQKNESLDQANKSLASAQGQLLDTVGKLKAAKTNLEQAKGDLEKTNASLKLEEAEANKQRALAYKNLYVTQMNMAHQAWQDGGIDQAKNLLKEAFKTKESKGAVTNNEVDLRGFEWYYLQGLLKRGADSPNLEGGGTSVAVFPGATPADALLAVSTTGPQGQPMLRFWRPSAGGKLVPVSEYTGPGANAGMLTFSKDGKYLAGRVDSTSIALWKMKAGKAEVWRTLDLGGEVIMAFAFTPDATQLVTGHADKLVRIWDLDSGKAVGAPLKHDWVIYSLAISPDGNRLVCGVGRYAPDKGLLRTGGKSTPPPAAGRVYVWDHFRDNPGPPLILTGHADKVTAVAISPDGQRIASASFDHSVRVWEGGPGQTPVCRQVLMHGLEVLSVAFSPDNKYLASAGWDKLVRVWDSTTGHPVHTYAGHTQPIQAAAFLPGSGSGQLVSQSGNVIKVWSLATDQRFETVSPGGGSVLSAVFADQGHRLITFDRAGKLGIWDLASHQWLAKPAPPPGITIQALSPTGEWLLGRGNGGVQLFPLGAKVGPAVKLAQAPAGEGLAAFSADGRRLALASPAGIAVWDLAKPGQAPRTYAAATDVEGLALTPDGQQLVFVTGDGKGWIWAPDGTAKPQSFGDVGTGFNQMAVSPYGKLVAFANDDYTVTVWDVAAKKLLHDHPWQGHMCFVSSVAFSPDGKRLASGSEDWTIRIWDIDTGLTTLTLKGHQGRVLTVGFDADGQQLASTSEDGTARIWAATQHGKGK
jgi:WD40 repeat protein/serine/threonine protein kinase